MTSIPSLSDPSVAQLFFRPIHDFLASRRHSRSCPSLPDSSWIQLLVARVLFPATSGRGFLQELAALLADRPATGLFFESLKSSRRLALLAELNAQLLDHLGGLLPDRFAPYSALGDFDLYAGDGHWHGAAAHDPVCEGTKFATGHFFGLNLRHGAVFHLTTADSCVIRADSDTDSDRVRTRLRRMSDRIPDGSGQSSGGVRTWVRFDPDRVPERFGQDSGAFGQASGLLSGRPGFGGMV